LSPALLSTLYGQPPAFGRKAYLAALHGTWGSVELARLALAKACQRLAGNGL
jgi:hypothetical protein